MSENSDKPHEPSPHRLREARKRGEVYKSKDLSSTAALMGALLAFSAFGGLVADQLMALFTLSLNFQGLAFQVLLPGMLVAFFNSLLVCTLYLVIPVAVLGVLTEYLQVGVLFSSEKVNPDMNRINPAEGLKRIFNKRNLVEAILSFIKITLVFLTCALLIRQSLPDALDLFYATPQFTLALLWEYAWKMISWILIIFLCIGMFDYIHQRRSYMQRLRMSKFEVNQEFKQSEGDPIVKNQRRQLHKEWSTRSVTQATSRATALVTNPTHIAIAIHYDSAETPLPIVIAKGEGAIAALMRKTAEEYSIPVIQNVELARGLNDDAELEEAIPEDYFEAVAEVLLWAQGIAKGGSKANT